MKKRLRRSMLSFLMAIAMVVGMLPVGSVPAWANTIVVPLWVGGQQVVLNVEGDAASGSATISGNGTGEVRYEGGVNNGTLTLTDYHYEGIGHTDAGNPNDYANAPVSAGIFWGGIGTLTIRLVGDNVITQTGCGTEDGTERVYGIFGSGRYDALDPTLSGVTSDVAIEGENASLTVTSGPNDSESYGIGLDGGHLTINDATVYAEGGVGTESCGIHTFKGIDIVNGSVTAIGGDTSAYNGSSYGIYSVNHYDLSISGGTVRASGDKGHGSHGINAGQLHITNGAICEATASDGRNWSSGIDVTGNGSGNNGDLVVIDGGSLICSAGESYEHHSYGLDVGTGNDVKITEAENNSFTASGYDLALQADANSMSDEEKTVGNAIAGIGWTNVEGTEGQADIAANADVTTLTNYKKITFPKVRPGITATATGFSGEEDGQKHGITVSVTDPERDATIKYGTTEGTYDLTESPKYSKAGTYTVYYKITADGYSAMTGSATVTITEKKQEKKEDKPSQNPPAPSKVAVTGVTLNQTSAVVKKRATLQLSATVAPANATDKAVTYKSDDEEVATVSATGLVTAVAPGTATITATAGGKSVSCEIKVPGMKLNDNELVVRVKKTSKSIQAELVNDTIKSVESSNKKVATASFSGNTISVKGVKAGKATVTVTSESGITATLKVKVQTEKVTTTKIKFSKKSVTVKKGKKLVVKVEATPDRVSTGEKITVKCSNKSVAKVSYNAETGEITIVAKKKGICKVKAKAGKVTKTLKVTVK